MSLSISRFIFLLSWLPFFFGCSTPSIPPEVNQVKVQEHDLWRAGAETYARDEYLSYKSSINRGNNLLIKENNKFRWFRDYESAANEFRLILVQGRRLARVTEENKDLVSSNLSTASSHLSTRINSLKKITTLINEGRLARDYLTRAELLLGEAEKKMEEGRHSEASERLNSAISQFDLAVGVIRPIMNRFDDRDHLNEWRAWADETIRESKRNGSYTIVVSKVERTLTLYKNGTPIREYPVGLGFNGMKEKLQAGDRATPEGRYRIVKKLPKSRFYKALLINYPNEEDRRQFAAAKKKGVVPAGAGIGGLIEIHGGGTKGMTYGCVALENRHIEDLFNIVKVGTSVTIVGTVDADNNLSAAMKGF